MPVLTACVKHGINVTTSSYVSDAMMGLDEAAKKKGVTLLNECGLDPGIDIMGTMKVVDECRKRNWKVVSYESFCGGLPTAEQADNPLGYKFSWSPGAAIKASRNQAIFMKDGKRIVTDEPLKCVEDRDEYSVSMRFEVYPNRDSTVFQKRFGMEDCETFLRGTIRFKGFAGVISAFHDIGLTSDDPIDPKVSTLRELAMWRFTKVKPLAVDAATKELLKKLSVGMPAKDADLLHNIISRVDTSYLKNAKLVKDCLVQLAKSVNFLGFYDDKNHLKTKDAKGQARSSLDAFGDLMA